MRVGQPDGGAPLDLRRAAGLALPDYSVSWSVADAMLVALAAGMTPQRHLDHLYEARGPRVLPTLASVAGGQWLVPLLDRLGQDRRRAVLGESAVSLLRPLPPEAEVQVAARIEGIDARGTNASLLVAAELGDRDGPLARTRTRLVLLGRGGGWAAGAPARAVEAEPPAAAPDLEIETAAEPAAAAIFRLLFPLRAGQAHADAAHIDPALAAAAGFPAPAVHGVSVLGLVLRHLLEFAGAGTTEVTACSGRFRRPVLPGAPLRLRLWHLGGGAWHSDLHSAAGEPVLAGTRMTTEPRHPAPPAGEG